MYKCCWNCNESAPGHGYTKRATALLSVSRRYCCAVRPVSDYAINPFQRRYCKQFVERKTYPIGHEVTKEEADKLYSMTDSEKAAYWGVFVPDDTHR